jgi:hypothetical protein
VLQFVPNEFWNEYLFEQSGQDFDLPNQDKIVQRTGVGDDQPHRPLESNSVKVVPILVQVIHRKRKVDLMGLEHLVQCLARRQSEQTAQFRLREPAQSKLLDRQGFQDAPGQVAGSPKPDREVIGDVNGYIHGNDFTGAHIDSQKAQAFRSIKKKVSLGMTR